jgi:trans-aconitate methyltransferase
MSRPWDGTRYARTSDLQASVAAELIFALAIRPDENVLDLGCGLGNLTFDIGAMAYKGRVLGIDTSQSMIDQATSNSRSSELPNVSFLVASVDGLREEGRFDVVFSNSVLHWIKDQRQTLRAIHRCLRTGGRIGLQFPLLDSGHPLIAVTQKAVRSLGLEARYTAWRSPWFVPESADAYADLLRSLSFDQVDVKQRETTHLFDTPSTAFSFFASVGLELFLEPLTAEEAASLEARVLELLSDLRTERGVSLDFRRLYAFGSASGAAHQV